MAKQLEKLIYPPRLDHLAVDRDKLIPLGDAPIAPRLPLVKLNMGQFEGQVDVHVGGREVATVFQGRWEETRIEELSKAVDEQLSKWRGFFVGRSMLVQVDPTVRWSMTSGLLSQLASLGVGRAGLLVAIADPAPPVPPSQATADIKAMQAELAASLDPSNKALPFETPIRKRVAAHWKQATNRCPQIELVFERVGKVAPLEKGRTLLTGVAEALLACRCQVDLPVVHASLHSLLHEPAVGVIWFLHQRDGPSVTRPAEETWRQTVTRWLRRQSGREIRGQLASIP